jgi:hypothetical protein
MDSSLLRLKELIRTIRAFEVIYEPHKEGLLMLTMVISDLSLNF